MILSLIDIYGANSQKIQVAYTGDIVMNKFQMNGPLSLLWIFSANI